MFGFPRLYIGNNPFGCIIVRNYYIRRVIIEDGEKLACRIKRLM